MVFQTFYCQKIVYYTQFIKHSEPINESEGNNGIDSNDNL